MRVLPYKLLFQGDLKLPTLRVIQSNTQNFNGNAAIVFPDILYNGKEMLIISMDSHIVQFFHIHTCLNHMIPALPESCPLDLPWDLGLSFLNIKFVTYPHPFCDIFYGATFGTSNPPPFPPTPSTDNYKNQGFDGVYLTFK